MLRKHRPLNATGNTDRPAPLLAQIPEMHRVVLLMQQRISRRQHRLPRMIRCLQITHRVPPLHAVAHRDVLWVARIIPRRQHPLAQPEDRTWFQHARDPRVACCEIGRVDRRFDRVGSVEASLGERQGQVIALDEGAFVAQAGFGSEFDGAGDLAGVDRDADDVAAGEAGDFAGGAADAAADV